MKKSKFCDSQNMDALKCVEAGLTVPDLCCEVGISTATFYKWCAKFGGMDSSLMARMNELEEENRCLKKMQVAGKPKAVITGLGTSRKSNAAVSPPRDGQRSGGAAWHHTFGWPVGLHRQRVLLPL